MDGGCFLRGYGPRAPREFSRRPRAVCKGETKYAYLSLIHICVRLAAQSLTLPESSPKSRLAARLRREADALEGVETPPEPEESIPAVFDLPRSLVDLEPLEDPEPEQPEPESPVPEQPAPEPAAQAAPADESAGGSLSLIHI